MEASNYLAGGSISGVIVVCAYFIYKCFYRKKFRSKCCNSTIDISEDANVPPSPSTPQPENKNNPKIQIPN